MSVKNKQRDLCSCMSPLIKHFHEKQSLAPDMLNAKRILTTLFKETSQEQLIKVSSLLQNYTLII